MLELVECVVPATGRTIWLPRDIATKFAALGRVRLLLAPDMRYAAPAALPLRDTWTAGKGFWPSRLMTRLH
jgi:hypothetical protein